MTIIVVQHYLLLHLLLIKDLLLPRIVLDNTVRVVLDVLSSLVLVVGNAVAAAVHLQLLTVFLLVLRLLLLTTEWVVSASTPTSRIGVVGVECLDLLCLLHGHSTQVLLLRQ